MHDRYLINNIYHPSKIYKVPWREITSQTLIDIFTIWAIIKFDWDVLFNSFTFIIFIVYVSIPFYISHHT